MKSTLTIVISLLLITNAFATRQRPDKLVYDGKQYRTNSRECPGAQFYMEDYFKKHPEKRPRSGLMSTALYRGYVAIYEIKASQLVLSDVEIRTSHSPDKWKSVKNTIVTNDTPLVVDWFTGVIVLHPFDELVEGERRTSLSLNKGDTETILLQIENGDMTRVSRFAVGEYKKFKKKQFAAFKKTKEYELIVKERLKQGTKPAHVDIAINNFLMYYSRKILVKDVQPASESVNSPNKSIHGSTDPRAFSAQPSAP
jgi:hypothetical protein